MAPRAVVVGGGIMGTLHAAEALRRGWSVVHLDTDAEPQDASARSTGTVWITNRASGLELRLALRARERWRELAALAPGTGFRATGSLTVATEESHLQAFDRLLSAGDAEPRGLRYLTPGVLRTTEPAVRGEILGALQGTQDAVLEPRLALSALRNELLRGDSYRFLGGRQVWEVDSGSVIDTNGRVHRGDAVVVCTGAGSSVVTTMLTARAPLRRVKVQLVQTEPDHSAPRTLLVDADSMRWWDASDAGTRDLLGPAAPVVEEFRIQVLCVPRASGSLTIGESREVQEPFAFDLAERPLEHALHRVEALLGRPVPPVVRRWAGVFHECTDDRLWYREQVDQDVHVVTGAGQRGLTLAPAIAEDTFDFIETGSETGGSEPSARRDRT